MSAQPEIQELAPDALMTPAQLEAALHEIGAARYHNLHPFHKLLHGGKCSRAQVQAVNPFDCTVFMNHPGRIPAPLTSVRN